MVGGLEQAKELAAADTAAHSVTVVIGRHFRRRRSWRYEERRYMTCMAPTTANRRPLDYLIPYNKRDNIMASMPARIVRVKAVSRVER